MYSINARDHFNCSPLLFSWTAPQNRCGQTEGGSNWHKLLDLATYVQFLCLFSTFTSRLNHSLNVTSDTLSSVINHFCFFFSQSLNFFTGCWPLQSSLLHLLPRERTEQLDMIAGFLPSHWLYEWFRPQKTSDDICVVHDDLGWKNRTTRCNRFWRAGCIFFLVTFQLQLHGNRLTEISEGWLVFLGDHNWQKSGFFSAPVSKFGTFQGPGNKETKQKQWKSAQRDTNTAHALAVISFGHRPPARPPSQTHRQDRLQYITLPLASAQCKSLNIRIFSADGNRDSGISSPW